MRTLNLLINNNKINRSPICLIINFNYQALINQPKGIKMSLKVQVKVLDPRIGQDDNYPLPKRATAGSAGIDLRVLIDEDTVLKAGESRLFGTGLAFYLKDENYGGFVHPRSGLGSRDGIVIGNLTGIIDADYQGELQISLWNRSDKDYTIKVGDRVAQYIFAPIIRPEFDVVEEFDIESDRGAGGFGSSGK